MFIFLNDLLKIIIFILLLVYFLKWEIKIEWSWVRVVWRLKVNIGLNVILKLEDLLEFMLVWKYFLEELMSFLGYDMYSFCFNIC